MIPRAGTAGLHLLPPFALQLPLATSKKPSLIFLAALTAFGFFGPLALKFWAAAEFDISALPAVIVGSEAEDIWVKVVCSNSANRSAKANFDVFMID